MKRRSLLISLLVLLLVLNGCASTSVSSNAPAKIATEASNFKETDMKLQLETEHFIFYSTDKDKKCLEDLSNAAEGSYERITSDLKTPLDYKPTVRVYPDIKSFHISIGRPDDPDWGVGTAWGKNLRIVSPLNPGSVHDYESIKQVAVHEFAHVVQINMVDDPRQLPTWLWEGTATYEAKQMDEKTKQLMKQEAQKVKAPTLSQLTKDFYTVDKAYQYSYSIADFIVNKYGYDKLVEMIKNPKDIEKTLGVSMDELEKQWIGYVETNY